MLQIDPGAVTAYTVPLPTGTVRFDGDAGADITIDGKRLGPLPLAPVQVPTGTREFTARFEDGREQVEQIDVVVGGPTTLTVDASRAIDASTPNGALSVFPPGSRR